MFIPLALLYPAAFFAGVGLAVCARAFAVIAAALSGADPFR